MRRSLCREEEFTQGGGGQGVCGFTSASVLAPSLHLLPKTSRVRFQLDLGLYLHSVPRPQWTLPGSPLWAVVFGTYHFPVFNMADVFITVGGIMFIVHYLFLDKDAIFKVKNGKKNNSDS